jgi:hypothetical protein
MCNAIQLPIDASAQAAPVMPLESDAPSLQREVGDLALRKHLGRSTDVDDFISHIQGLLAPLGIDHFSHCVLGVFGWTGDVLDVFATYPADFIKRYTQEEFQYDDLALHHAKVTNNGFFKPGCRRCSFCALSQRSDGAESRTLCTGRKIPDNRQFDNE